MKTLTHPAARCAANARQRGFTLVELSIVLVIVGLIIGGITIARDVQRNAVYQRIASDFLQGWAIAYDRFVSGTGNVPGDNFAAPTGRVGGAINTPLCGLALRTAMQAAGIEMPAGRAEGAPDQYAYLDSNGMVHNLQVCFQNVNWSEPGAAPGTYVVLSRNVMTLNGVTPALATLVDNQFDTIVDARFGRVRELVQAANVGAASAVWGVDERMALGQTVATARDEDQVAEVTAFIKMSR